MYIEKNSGVKQLIPLYGGYSGEKFCDYPENRSGFFLDGRDDQCSIPIDGVAEFKEEFINKYLVHNNDCDVSSYNKVLSKRYNGIQK